MKTLIVTAGLISQEGKVLITQRREGVHCGLLWEFPGGKVEDGEEPRQALRRELKEELGIETEVGGLFAAAYHAYQEYPILLVVYHSRIVGGIPNALGCRDFEWFDLPTLRRLAMPPADEPIRRKLCSTQASGPFFAERRLR